MNWSFAAKPNPEMSAAWSDEFWPPKEWYDLVEGAPGRAGMLWKWDDPKNAKTLARKMTEEQLLLWAVNNVVGQICNGGFSQALYNSYGELAEEAILGLRKFGLERHADIIDEAWNVFGVRPVPRDREARIKRLERLSRLEKLPSFISAFIQHASAIFTQTSKGWYDMETEFFCLLHEKTDSKGYNAAYYRPLAEWIYAHRDRFFIV